ncbi:MULTISPECIES: MerR family transcriptional regulator [unclassified Streptomyces]|uniref:MerR family transcriptional regulator n=1 Tax=Streptomyces TaxID=1883 RepID=UPI0001C198D3|nr:MULTISPECIES: MerR family transcriptional regulator [unclassified Streptomyces]MYR67686.1 MerR family transcriptional regulator [Streptomyces sp. SID4939]MYS02473.1 MerR family transcriptional regulator [Streptomyces sp. SID4940]AEN14089.1 regulatory protein MerR [Streptomyces sp. SirexAA-E]MYT67977.1 MerR family transcriptional regulator [Streptomyces sp. SID8357]MYT86820.1 MerR family transcriptional regulator [Streptomyces sp. SID8360]
MSIPGHSGRRSGPRTVPTELAALAAGVSPATIRKWASRGKLTRHGTPRRAEYDLEELRALAAGSSRAPRPERSPGPAQR